FIVRLCCLININKYTSVVLAKLISFQYIGNWVKRMSILVKVNSIANRFTLKNLFDGFDEDETLQIFVIDIITNNLEAKDDEILEKCKESLITIASPDGIIRAELSILEQDEVDR